MSRESCIRSESSKYLEMDLSASGKESLINQLVCANVMACRPERKDTLVMVSKWGEMGINFEENLCFHAAELSVSSFDYDSCNTILRRVYNIIASRNLPHIEEDTCMRFYNDLVHLANDLSDHTQMAGDMKVIRVKKNSVPRFLSNYCKFASMFESATVPADLYAFILTKVFCGRGMFFVLNPDRSETFKDAVTNRNIRYWESSNAQTWFGFMRVGDMDECAVKVDANKSFVLGEGNKRTVYCAEWERSKKLHNIIALLAATKYTLQF